MIDSAGAVMKKGAAENVQLAMIEFFGLPTVNSNIGNSLCLNLVVLTTKKFNHEHWAMFRLPVLATSKFTLSVLGQAEFQKGWSCTCTILYKQVTQLLV